MPPSSVATPLGRSIATRTAASETRRERAVDVRSSSGRVRPVPNSASTSNGAPCAPVKGSTRSEEHTSELQSLMRISYAVFCLKKKTCEQNRTLQPTIHQTEQRIH